VRSGPYPRLDPRYPCLQLDQEAPSEIVERLVTLARRLPGVEVRETELSVPAWALVLEEDLALGPPEAFIFRREFVLVRREGSLQLTLVPEWGQKVLEKKWGTIHPLVRYMAGSLPPQHLVIYAPRNPSELGVVWRILLSAYFYALGEVLLDWSHLGKGGKKEVGK